MSIEGFVGALGKVEPADVKQLGRWVRDITVANVQCQGLRVRILHNSEDGTEFFEEGIHVHIKFAKNHGHRLVL